MKLTKLLEATVLQKVKRKVIDALALIKISDVSEVPTDSVIEELGKQGIFINKNELIDILSDTDIIHNITDEYITFEEQETLGDSTEDREISSSNKVSQLADKALNKRM